MLKYTNFMSSKILYSFGFFILITTIVVSLTTLNYKNGSNRESSLSGVIKSPTPSVSPSPTSSPLPSPTPSPTPSPSPSPSPKITPTPTFSPIPSPKITPTPAFSPIPSPKIRPTPAFSPTPVISVSPSPSPSPTPRPTPSPSPSLSPSPSPTIKPTPSPTPTLAPSPNPGLKAEVTLFIDPDYIKMRETKYLVTPGNDGYISPYDQIDVLLKIPKQEAKKYKKLDVSIVLAPEFDNPKTKEITSIINGDLQTSSYLNMVSNDYDYYFWKSPNWPEKISKSSPPASITRSEYDLKKLLESGKIKAVVFGNMGVEGETGPIIGESQVKSISSCFHLYGVWGEPGSSFMKSKKLEIERQGRQGFSILFARDEAAGADSSNFISANPFADPSNFYSKPDPFATYQDSFSAYVDLNVYKAFPYSQALSLEGGEYEKYINDIHLSSQCSSKGLKSPDLTSMFLGKSGGGFYWRINKVITIGGGIYVFGSNTFWHEVGHYFGLDDEYVYKEEAPKIMGSNCSATSNCNEFITRFGKAENGWDNYNQGCYLGCIDNSHYRSSINSIMNSSMFFNKLSCAVILNKVFPNNRQSDNWNNCNRLNVAEYNHCWYDKDCFLTEDADYSSISACGVCKTEGGVDLSRPYYMIGTNWPTCTINPNRDCMMSATASSKPVFGFCYQNRFGSSFLRCQKISSWICNSLGGCGADEKCDLSTHKCIKI